MSALSEFMCYVFMFMLVTSNLDSSQANRWQPKHKLALKSRSCKKHLKGPHGYSKKEWDRCLIEFYSHYHEVDEILDSIDLLSRYTKLNVDVETIGSTYEKRPLRVTRIINPGAPHVYIQSGLHAREWIAQATGAFLLFDYLMGNEFSTKFNFHLLTMANPDGYNYSRTVDNDWRKNRRPRGTKCPNGEEAVGVDLNRNFDDKWGLTGASDDPCDRYTYMGHEPGSEAETQAIEKYLKSLPETPILGLDIHSFYNGLLYSYGYKEKAVPDNIKEIIAMAEKAVTAIPEMKAVKASALGEASGAADDWMKEKMCIRFVYTYELPDYGQKFHPDEKHIYPTANQVRDSIDIMLREILKIVEKEKADFAAGEALPKKWCDKGQEARKAKSGAYWY